MAEWDFRADIDTLMGAALNGKGRQSMTETVAAADQIVTYSTAQGPGDLEKSLLHNASMLVGQQLLVLSVHSQRDILTRFRAALGQWADEGDTGDHNDISDKASPAVEWLKERYPGLLRAWLLSQIDNLVREALLDVS